MLPRERLKKDAEAVLKKFMQEITFLKPKCILLFGSYAREDFTESSDIDICIISENLPPDELQRRSLRSLYSTPKIKAIGFYPEEFLNYLRNLRLIAYDILSEGQVLYDQGFFCEARRTYQECLKKFKLIKESRGWRRRI